MPPIGDDDPGPEQTALGAALGDASNAATVVAVTGALALVGGISMAALLAVAVASAVGGGIVGRQISEVVDNTMGQLRGRQRERVETAIEWALTEIALLRARGLPPRAGLLVDGAACESDEEVYEGALMLARDSYERRRLRHLAAFIARFAFAPDLWPVQAQFLLRLADALTYRQYCLLHVLSGRYSSELPDDDFRRPDRSDDANADDGEPPSDLTALLQEATELARRGLLQRKDNTALLGLADVNPALMRLTPLGTELAHLLDVEHTGIQERREILKMLNRPGAFPPAAS